MTRFPVEKSGEAGEGEASAASQSAELFSCHMTQKGKSRNVLASPLGEEGHEVAKGVQANWIHRGEKRPANPVTRFPVGERLEEAKGVQGRAPI